MPALAHGRVNHPDRAKELARRKEIIGHCMDTLHTEILEHRADEKLATHLQKLRGALLVQWRRLDAEAKKEK